MSGAAPDAVRTQPRSRRTALMVAAAVAVVALVAVGVVVATAGSNPAPRHTAGEGVTARPTGQDRQPPQHQVASEPVAPQPAVPASFLVATLSHDVTRYASPGGPAVGTVASTWYGEPSALPVIAQANGYLEVRLQQRPNGSTAWIASPGVPLSSTPYEIVIHLSTERLDLYEHGTLVLDAPAGIGTSEYPTPTGNFFVAFFAAPPSAGYGPFVIVTSGHSNAISDWEESGDALVAIHGPLGADAEIGTTGAEVSHGCVRLHVSDLEHLREVPAGSPIDIVA